MSNTSRKHCILDHVNHKKCQVNKIGQTESIMCYIINMSSINTWRRIVQQTSFLNWSFLVRTKNQIVYMCYVSIITCILIPKQYMAPVRYVTSLVCVLNAYIYDIQNLGSRYTSTATTMLSICQILHTLDSVRLF